MAEEQPEAEAVWPFYYPNVRDSATKAGYIAADIFVIVFGLLFIWGVFWH